MTEAATISVEASTDDNLKPLAEALSAFLESNPVSVLSDDSGDEREVIAQINFPWGDPTLAITLPEESDEIVSALNQVCLPDKFSAIWHVNARHLEVIWTPFKLSDALTEVLGRRFNFHFRGKSFECEFGHSSDTLLTIAKHIRPQKAASDTAFRNIQPFNHFALLDEDDRKMMGMDKPLSFWVRGFEDELNQEALIELARHINFYLTYYDRRCPQIIIHSDPMETKFAAAKRYVADQFPPEIRCLDLDENLLSFWTAAHYGNEILRFMLYYRVIEYAAFHHVASATKQTVKQILASPHLSADLDGGVAKIVAALAGSALDDVPRYENLLQSVVATQVLWDEIAHSREAFCADVITDGGFCIQKIISPGDTFENFEPQGVVKVARSLRKIRNCLSHGKDQGSDGVITPTSRNLALLRPWVNLISKAAGEVVVYSKVA